MSFAVCAETPEPVQGNLARNDPVGRAQARARLLPGLHLPGICPTFRLSGLLPTRRNGAFNAVSRVALGVVGAYEVGWLERLFAPLAPSVSGVSTQWSAVDDIDAELQHRAERAGALRAEIHGSILRAEMT
jgi:hypothetical protein